MNIGLCIEIFLFSMGTTERAPVFFFLVSFSRLIRWRGCIRYNSEVTAAGHKLLTLKLTSAGHKLNVAESGTVLYCSFIRVCFFLPPLLW